MFKKFLQFIGLAKKETTPVVKPPVVEKPVESVDKEEPVAVDPKWMKAAEKEIGNKETDKAFDKRMSSWWKKSGIAFTTIVGSAFAWCGLFAYMILNQAGLSTPDKAYRAKNWDGYGHAIAWKQDGIPRGSAVRLNSDGNCDSSKGNHITFAAGDCTAKELTAKDATFDGLGGNQGNMVKVSTYKASTICYVGYPPELPKPPKVTVSKNCSSKKTGSESTR